MANPNGNITTQSTQATGLGQIEKENSKIEADLQRIRVTPAVVTGVRNLKEQIYYDDGITTRTSYEKMRNRIYFSKFLSVADSPGGLGNQQPLPFEIGLPPNNPIITGYRKNQELRYSGDLYDSGAYLRPARVTPKEVLDRYKVAVIRANPIRQEMQSIKMTPAGPGERFHMQPTADLMPPRQYRQAPQNRLQFQVKADGNYQ